MDTHARVFQWVLGVIADRGLLKGKTVGVDATTLEANAAMRSIIRRDTGASYDEFLTELARQSGIPTPTREDLARLFIELEKKTPISYLKHLPPNINWLSPDRLPVKAYVMACFSELTYLEVTQNDIPGKERCKVFPSLSRNNLIPCPGGRCHRF